MARRINLSLRMPRYLASHVSKRAHAAGLSVNEWMVQQFEAALPTVPEARKRLADAKDRPRPWSTPAGIEAAAGAPEVHGRMTNSAAGYRLPNGERHPAVGAE